MDDFDKLGNRAVGLGHSELHMIYAFRYPAWFCQLQLKPCLQPFGFKQVAHAQGTG
jgi:hypothetical protein